MKGCTCRPEENTWPEESPWLDESEASDVIAYSDYLDSLDHGPIVRSERFDSQPELMKPIRISERLRKRCLLILQKSSLLKRLSLSH